MAAWCGGRRKESGEQTDQILTLVRKERYKEGGREEQGEGKRTVARSKKRYFSEPSP
jgi:hypothetical protein